MNLKHSLLLQQLASLAGMFFLFFLLGCERDDICSENTPITPLLTVSFKNNNNVESAKAVAGLQVKIIIDSVAGIEKIVPTIAASASSISLPLPTKEETITYEFIKNSGSEASTGSTVEKRSKITLTYNISEPKYINRACGYRVTFSNFKIASNVFGTTDDWIINASTKESFIKIENEESEEIPPELIIRH